MWLQRSALRVSLTEDAGENGLTEVYGKLKDEALNLNLEYAPKSVNTDAWKATIKSWKLLFPNIFVICCFMHEFIYIRGRGSMRRLEK